MEEANNKKPKEVDEEHDRLSNLSDELIFHILSFLSTKESYGTCVLSKKWASICTKIPDLHFELLNDSDPMLSKGIQSVHAALINRTENIRRLSLFSQKGCQPYDVHLWVSKALNLKVQDLNLECWSLGKPTLLPFRLSLSKSLVVLTLGGETRPIFNSSFDVYFPSLKILHLKYIVLNSIWDDHMEYDLSNFLSGCPNLEEFLFQDCLKQPINIVSFHLLKRLYLKILMPSIAGIEPLQINVPASLDVLVIEDFSPKKYEVINLSDLDRAILCISKHPDFNSLYTLLKGLSSVKSLTLSSKTIHFLSMEDNIDNLLLLTFHKLLFLSVEISENCNWNMLVTLLQNTPKLKDLVIKNKIKSQRKEVGNLGWVEPSETLTCLSTSLITFEFNEIHQKIQIELDFARYIINNSNKLEKVNIFSSNSKKTVESLLKGSKKSSLLVWDINSI